MPDLAAPPGRRARHRITRRGALRAATALLAGVAASSLLPGWAPALAQGEPGTDEGAEEDAAPPAVTIVNRSTWVIHHLFLSSSADEEWGPDQLEEDILPVGGRLTLTNISCDMYDVRLVDEAGDECVIHEVDICGGAEGWVIRDDDLLECQAYAADTGRCPAV